MISFVPVMIHFVNKDITIASVEDIVAVKILQNNAYRGENSKQGWTTEAYLIAGSTRTDENMLRQVIDQPGSVILIYKDDEQNITGCVNLQKHAGKLYLGMFSVSPQLQGRGIGKLLLQAAEEYALRVGCKSIYMSAISLRSELIDWYKRHGYSDTGERKPFVEDGVTGKHLRPLEFMIMEKLV
jgi:ribosomal protein S18 acetylase RimI-like enzyme